VTAARRFGVLALPAGLGALVVWLSFSAGGFFADRAAVAAIACGLALVAWLLIARRPLAGLSPWLAVAAGGLIAFALWTLVSQGWSDAPARALVEFDRVLLYALAVIVVGLAAALPAVRANVPRAVAAALVIVVTCGLISRLLPDLWPIAADIEFERLSYPVTYWNALGAIGVLTTILCLHLSASTREPAAVRALAAAAIPIAATTVLYTFSRGAIALAPIGFLVYFVLARPPGAVAALLAILPTTAVALVVAYGADAVVEQTAPTAAGISQGKTVALVVALCAVAAAGLLLALRPLDARVARWRLPRPRRPWVPVAVVAVLVVVAAVAVDLPGRISAQADRLDNVSKVQETGDSRARLTQLADNGRVDSWRVALEAFSENSLHGTGAGTFALVWPQNRDIDQDVTDAHSLYLEALAELGLVGALLLVVALGALLVGTAVRARGPDRAQGAVAFAVLLTWALHAGIDWDWEVPALTLPVLALAAAAVAARPTPEREPVTASRRWPVRAVAAVALLALLLTPLAIVRSQSSLDQALTAMRAGSCETATVDAQRSIDRLSVRPEPYQVLSVCALRAGQARTSLAWMQAALDRDPANWRLLYDVAIVRATQGLDPRAALREAHRRNPRSFLVGKAVEIFATDSSTAWRRQALAAQLLV
jgi:hypothetical protein